MTQDLDALPEPTWPSGFFGQLGGDAFTADQIRAARREGYELAKREAQAYFDTLPLIPEGGVPVDVYNEAMQSLAKAVEERDKLKADIGPLLESVTRLEDELRKAQEGREPVAWRIHPHDYGIGSAGAYAITQLPQQKDAWLKKGWAPEPLYTSPPPKSDEARDAERYRWLRRKVCVIGKSTYCGEETGIPIFDFVNLPDVGEVVNRDSASTLDAAIDAALAAQQKGGM
ncbi:MAG TPA: hypothetical protein VFM33_10050 [Aquabacterium sp.]|nr:hypothetical protein [Aquabacterium sp.]